MKHYKKHVLFSLIIIAPLAIAAIVGHWRQEQPTEIVEQPKQRVLADRDQTQTKAELGSFGGQQFKRLFLERELPNTTRIAVAPAITGIEPLDQRIRNLAEARGYQLQSVPSSDLNHIYGHYLQEPARQDWQRLRKAARKDGVVLEIIFAYRSVGKQRQLFIDQLPTNLSNLSDVALNSVLRQYAPPGYSKHHTGYAIDLRDGKNSQATFEFTPAYRWIAADNFRNAKRFGFMPSYPEGARNQGPSPEPWEFVWIGDIVLSQP